VKHKLYFNSANDARAALQIIKQKFAKNATSEGDTLSFATSYTIRQGAQTSIAQSVKSHKGDFNIQEG